MWLQPKIYQIPSVQTNQTSIEKAMTAIVNFNERLSHFTPEKIKALAKIANCDMSVALNLLRVSRGLQKAAYKSEGETLKDLQDTNLFHRFGRIMYNKRRIEKCNQYRKRKSKKLRKRPI